MKINLIRISLTCVLLMSSGMFLQAAEETLGKAVFDKWCVHCHGDGTEYPATQILAIKFGETRSVIEARDDLEPQYIKSVVRNGRNSMPSFRLLEISNDELQALAKYLGK